MKINIENTADKSTAIIVYLIGLVGMAISFLSLIAVFKSAIQGSHSMEETIAFCFFFGFFGFFAALFFSMNRLSAKLLAEYNSEEQ